MLRLSYSLLVVLLLFVQPCSGDDADATANSALIAQRDEIWKRAQELQTAGSYGAAIVEAEKVLELERQAFGETHAELTGTLQVLSAWCMQDHAPEKALLYAKQRYSLNMVLYGKDAWQVKTSHWEVDYLGARQGLYDFCGVQKIKISN